jgi:hypothetical protein
MKYNFDGINLNMFKKGNQKIYEDYTFDDAAINYFYDILKEKLTDVIIKDKEKYFYKGCYGAITLNIKGYNIIRECAEELLMYISQKLSNKKLRFNVSSYDTPARFGITELNKQEGKTVGEFMNKYQLKFLTYKERFILYHFDDRAVAYRFNEKLRQGALIFIHKGEYIGYKFDAQRGYKIDVGEVLLFIEGLDDVFVDESDIGKVKSQSIINKI